MASDKIVKDQIKALIGEANLSTSETATLLNELISSDKENVHFSVDAGIIDRLGKELVARHETALSELVKNAYDADATTVDLIFENTDKIGGTLTITDDGHGMNRKQLINGFMRISSSEKIRNPTSPIYNRIRAGRKGIGRFATQRLGENLTIDTQAIDTAYSLEVKIDWGRFSQDRDLNAISNSIKEKPRELVIGTTLVIDNLREVWTEAAIKRVYRYISELLQPFPLSKKEKNFSSNDPGFTARFWKAEKGNLKAVADETSMFYEHAIAEIEGYVESDGQGYWFMSSNKLSLPDKNEIFSIGKDSDNQNTPFSNLQDIHFKAYYYIFNIGLIPKTIEKYIRNRLKEIGGIRVYRNGFRVLPYGESNNDWVGLEESSGSRKFLFPHGHDNLLGFVEIEDKTGKIFNELSSREGLFKNKAYDELVNFIYRVIIASARRVAAVRGRKETPSQSDFNTPEKKLESAITSILNVAKEYEKKGDVYAANSLKLISRVIEEAKSDQQKFSRELIGEIEMLRVLASLGLTIGEFTHEIKYYLPAIKIDINYLTEKIKDSVAQNRGKRIIENMNALESYTSYFDSIISQNILRDKKPIELREVVQGFCKTILSDLKRTGIELGDIDYSGYDLFTCPMHPSEWASILFNFYTNSKKAIKRAGVKGVIKISVGKENSKVYLNFCDNGDGIPEKNQNNVFDAFFTTSAPYKQDSSYEEQIMGSGLGLKIVKDIIDSYSGSIEVVDSPQNLSTCIRVELPEATKEDYKKYDL